MIEQVSAAYHKAGKKVVVLLNICSPVETASWKNLVDGIVCTWQSGEQVGNSMADVLSGKVNPSGRLPITFENVYGDAASDKNFPSDVKDMKDLATMYMWGGDKSNTKREKKANIDYTDYNEDVYVGYLYFDSFNKSVSYPFGYGKSYTTFTIENAEVELQEGKYVITAEVVNEGDVAGKDVVELFVAAPNSKKLNKPVRELRDYAKTGVIAPGQRETITLNVDPADLASFNTKSSSWVVDAGTYQFQLSSSSEKVDASVAVKVKAQKKKVNNVMAPQVSLKLLKR